MPNVNDLKAIIRNLSKTENESTKPANTKYPVISMEEKKSEVRDIMPLTPPAYDSAQVQQPSVAPVPKPSPVAENSEAKVAPTATATLPAEPVAYYTTAMPDKAAVDAFVRTLVPGTDLLTTIPGIKNFIITRIGCQKILKFFRIRTSVTMLDKTVDPAQEFISYTFKVSGIYEGEVIYEAVGSANSHEAKFKFKGMSSDVMLSQIAIKRANTALVMYLLAR